MSVDVTPFAAEYPWAAQHLEVSGGRLAYLDEGEKDAPPLLMLHGNPTWSFYFRHLVRAFSPTHRAVAPDHIGCGRSDKPQDWSYRLADHVDNVERLVDHLGLERMTLVVHDWGGAIGMGFAVRRPERVARIVVSNTAAFPSDRMPASIALCRIPGFGALSIRGLNAFARVALLRCVVDKARLTPAVKAGYVAPYDSWANRVANLRFVEDIPMGPSHPSHRTLLDIEAGLPKLADRPMLLAWGGQDFVFDRHFYDEWRRRFPTAEARYLDDAGHYVLEDAHERIVPWMTQFMEEHPV